MTGGERFWGLDDRTGRFKARWEPQMDGNARQMKEIGQKRTKKYRFCRVLFAVSERKPSRMPDLNNFITSHTNSQKTKNGPLRKGPFLNFGQRNS